MNKTDNLIKKEASLFNVAVHCPECDSIMAVDIGNKRIYCCASSCSQYEIFFESPKVVLNPVQK